MEKGVNGIASMTPKNLFYASIDIRTCYDSINLEELLNAMQELLSEDEYLMQRHSVYYPFASMDKVFKKNAKKVGPIDNYEQFHEMSSSLSRRFTHSVFADIDDSAILQKKKIVALLEEHVSCHLVSSTGRYGRRFLTQSRGIPQGSILSTVLCNSYYGKVEKNLLNGRGIPTQGIQITPTSIAVLLRIVEMVTGAVSWSIHRVLSYSRKLAGENLVQQNLLLILCPCQGHYS